jgi:integrase/recombinase XerD
MEASDSPEKVLRTAREAVQRSDIPEQDKTAILSAADNSDKAARTLRSYIRQLKVLSEEADKPLVDHTAAEMKTHIDNLGERREWSNSTFKNYECATLMLVGHLGLDKSEIEVTTQKPGSRSIDVRNVITQEDFHDIREAASRIQNKALIDLLGYTGQRVRVAQLLKLTHVDLENGVWYMPDGEGLKGADEPMNKRPLLGAEKTMGQLIEQHPTGEPDDHVFTTMTLNGTEPGEMVQTWSLSKAIHKCGDAAGVDKPTNPHAFRHHFVTVAKQRYNMENSVIKKLLGHSPDSNIMESTYAHISDDKVIEQAQEAMGLDDDKKDDTQAPPVCPACQRPLRPSLRKCPTPGCGERFGEGGSAPDVTVPEGPEEELAQFLEEHGEQGAKVMVDMVVDSVFGSGEGGKGDSVEHESFSMDEYTE